jgi:hypothetical protein
MTGCGDAELSVDRATLHYPVQSAAGHLRKKFEIGMSE